MHKTQMGYSVDLASPLHYTEAMPRDEEKAQERGFYRYSLRVPLALYAQVEATSAQHRRSVHEQILWYIEQGIARERERRGDESS